MKSTKICPECEMEHSRRRQYCGKELTKACSVCKENFETRCNTREKKLCSRFVE